MTFTFISNHKEIRYMKNLILFAAILIGGIILTPFSAEAKKHYISKTIYDSNGGKWVIKGWVDVSVIPPGINDWDLWVTDPNDNKIHFNGPTCCPQYDESTGMFSFKIEIEGELQTISFQSE